MTKREIRITVTALVVSVMLAMGVTTALAEPQCPTSLKGTYGLAEKGSLTIEGLGLVPYASVGTAIADGNGSFEGTSTSSYNGFIVFETFQGTYTVNSDCTGVASFTGNVVDGTANRALVILRHGREIQFIATDPGQVITGHLTKVTGD